MQRLAFFFFNNFRLIKVGFSCCSNAKCETILKTTDPVFALSKKFEKNDCWQN